MRAFAVGDMRKWPPKGRRISATRQGPCGPDAQSALAEIAAAARPAKPIPIVLAGLARLFEFTMLLLAGVAIHEWHVAPAWDIISNIMSSCRRWALFAVVVIQALGL